MFPLFHQRGVFRGGPGPGEADRPHVRRQMHPQEGSEGEGEQHRERDCRAEEVRAVTPPHTHLLVTGQLWISSVTSTQNTPRPPYIHLYIHPSPPLSALTPRSRSTAQTHITHTRAVKLRKHNHIKEN